MFSQRKSFFRRNVYFFVVIGILCLGYIVNKIPFEDLSIGNEIESANENVAVAQSSSDENNKNGSSNSNNYQGEDGEIKNPQTQQVIEDSKSEYYLVKSFDGIVKIYHYDCTGKEEMLKETDISFELLSKEDQELFKQGIIIKNEEELQSLMEDFES